MPLGLMGHHYEYFIGLIQPKHGLFSD